MREQKWENMSGRNESLPFFHLTQTKALLSQFLSRQVVTEHCVQGVLQCLPSRAQGENLEECMRFCQQLASESTCVGWEGAWAERERGLTGQQAALQSLLQCEVCRKSRSLGCRCPTACCWSCIYLFLLIAFSLSLCTGDNKFLSLHSLVN